MKINNMKLFCFVIIITIAGCVNETRTDQRTVFYLDATNGNDSNTGTSPEQAWQSLNKASGALLKPGGKLQYYQCLCP